MRHNRSNHNRLSNLNQINNRNEITTSLTNNLINDDHHHRMISLTLVHINNKARQLTVNNAMIIVPSCFIFIRQKQIQKYIELVATAAGAAG